MVLQVSESTVRRLAHTNRIPSIRLTPRIIRFHLQQVRRALGVSAPEETEIEAGTNANGATNRARPRRSSDIEKDDPQLSFADLLWKE